MNFYCVSRNNRPGLKFLKGLCLTLLLLCLEAPSAAQPRVYFVDGYHGGIYGHYPVEWKTRFLADQLEAHPEWRICLEIEPETWDTVQVRTPADYARFAAVAADKRIEFTNPAYAQPYCYNVSGESIIRQLAYGIRKIHSHFPQVRFTTYSVEEPCFTSCLPQVLKLFGFKYASLKCPNTCWGGYTAPYGGELVNWIGPDGTSILASPRYACEDLQRGSVWQTTAWGNEKEYLDACVAAGIENPVGMCFQDAGWKYGPWIGSGDSIRNNSTYVTWREYFEQVADGETPEDYRFTQEEVRPGLMWGSQVLQRIARQVRRSENRLVTAEKMGVIANLANGYTYRQPEMDEAWRTLMLAQHHDSWIVPYNGLNERGSWADNIALWTAATDERCDAIIDAAGHSFTGKAAPKGAVWLRIYNTLGKPRTETVSAQLPAEFRNRRLVVTNAAGRKVPSFVSGEQLQFRAGIPAFGYATYLVKQAGELSKAPEEVAAKDISGEYILENDMYRIVIDPARGGVITSLKAKQEGGREFVDRKSEYALGELRGHFYDENTFHSSVQSPATVTVLENNDLVKSIRIAGRIASHPFTQVITIREGDRKIDFDLGIDWEQNVGIGAYAQRDGFGANSRAFYDDRYNLSVLFPVALASPSLSKDAPFDVCESKLVDTRFSTWDAIKHNVLLHWADLAEGNGGYGFALLSDHTTSYSYGAGRPLGLTVQFSGNGLWGRDYVIDRPTRMRFAIVPHRDAWDTAGVQEESLGWNEPLICAFLPKAGAGEASLIDTGESGYEISAAYTDGGATIVRLFNASGSDSVQKIRFGFPVAKAEIVDLNGHVLAACDVCRTGNVSQVEVSMPRFGLKTLRLTK